MKQPVLLGMLLLLIAVFLQDASAAPTRAWGTVITTGEGRIVLQVETGSQMTLETSKKDLVRFIQSLEEGQRIAVEYGTADGGHYGLRSAALVARGRIITKGADRLVVESEKRGQVTLEAATVKWHGKTMKHQWQIRFIDMVKKGDLVEAAYRPSDQRAHYIIADFGGSLRGVLTGSVITTGEDRVVVQSDNGAQMMLKAGWVTRGNRFLRNEGQIEFLQTLKPDDKVHATWVLGEGAHFILRSIAKITPDGRCEFPGETTNREHTEREHPRRLRRAETSPLARELRAMQEEIASLKKEVARIKAQLTELAQRRDGRHD